MKIRYLIKNTLRFYRKNWFWSILLSVLLAFLFLLFTNLYLLSSRMDVFYKTVNLLDSYDTSTIEVENISDIIAPPETPDFSPSVMDNYQTNLIQDLLIDKQAGYIVQYDREFSQVFFGGFDSRDYSSFNNIVIISGKYLEFANVEENFSDKQVYAFVSEDLAPLVGTEFEFSGVTMPILDTINYSYPIDIFQYAITIVNDGYQEDFRGYDYKTIYIATNSLETINDLRPFNEVNINQIHIFNPSEELLFDFNSYYSTHSGNIGFYLNQVDNNTRFDETNPIKLRIDSIVIGNGSLLIFVIFIANLLQNIKDQDNEFKIHMQFGADDPFIFLWIHLYVVIYLLPSVFFIPALLFFTLPSSLTHTNILLGLLVYILGSLVVAYIAFRRFKNTNRV